MSFLRMESMLCWAFVSAGSTSTPEITDGEVGVEAIEVAIGAAFAWLFSLHNP
jgi:hypothetical protein